MATSCDRLEGFRKCVVSDAVSALRPSPKFVFRNKVRPEGIEPLPYGREVQERTFSRVISYYGSHRGAPICTAFLSNCSKPVPAREAGGSNRPPSWEGPGAGSGDETIWASQPIRCGKVGRAWVHSCGAPSLWRLQSSMGGWTMVQVEIIPTFSSGPALGGRSQSGIVLRIAWRYRGS